MAEKNEKVVKTEKALAKKLKKEKDKIIIEGDLVDKVIKIKATGRAAWIIAIGAIGVALVAIYTLPATAGFSAIANVVAGTAAASVLGLSTAVSATTIAFFAGGVSALDTLRDYEIASRSDDRLTLVRKN